MLVTLYGENRGVCYQVRKDRCLVKKKFARTVFLYQEAARIATGHHYERNFSAGRSFQLVSVSNVLMLD